MARMLLRNEKGVKMKINKKSKLIGAALVIAAVVFVGTASTAALVRQAGVGATLGYDAITVAGGTVVSMHYNLSNATNPDTIATVTVVVVDPAITNGNLVPTLEIRIDKTPTAATAQTSCGAGVQSGDTAGVAGAGVGTVAGPNSVVTFTCGTLDDATGAVNALTLTNAYMTIQNA